MDQSLTDLSAVPGPGASAKVEPQAPPQPYGVRSASSQVIHGHSGKTCSGQLPRDPSLLSSPWKHK